VAEAQQVTSGSAAAAERRRESRGRPPKPSPSPLAMGTAKVPPVPPRSVTTLAWRHLPLPREQRRAEPLTSRLISQKATKRSTRGASGCSEVPGLAPTAAPDAPVPRPVPAAGAPARSLPQAPVTPRRPAAGFSPDVATGRRFCGGLWGCPRVGVPGWVPVGG